MLTRVQVQWRAQRIGKIVRQVAGHVSGGIECVCPQSSDSFHSKFKLHNTFAIQTQQKQGDTTQAWQREQALAADTQCSFQCHAAASKRCRDPSAHLLPQRDLQGAEPTQDSSQNARLRHGTAQTREKDINSGHLNRKAYYINTNKPLTSCTVCAQWCTERSFVAPHLGNPHHAEQTHPQ